MQESSLERLTPRKELDAEQLGNVFEHIYRRLAVHRNDAERWVNFEEFSDPDGTGSEIREEFVKEINEWANVLLENAWIACQEPGEKRPNVDAFADTSLRDLAPLPPQAIFVRLLNTILLLHITSTKHYSAHTRSFLLQLAPLDEEAASTTLHNPKKALADAEMHARTAKDSQAKKNRWRRAVGIGGAALAGGVLVGVTGGLAAPLVGAGVATLLGALGVGGSAAGVLAAGLASSGAVCGALFGAYGAKSGADMVARHTKEVADFDIVPVRKPLETLAVRVCVSGWLGDKGDVTAPWTVLDESEDTFALQWEVEALEKLSTALRDLLKSNGIKLVRTQILKHTFLAALTSALAPLALLKVGELVDNPWANAKALAIKTGQVLGELLALGVFGTRPVSLYGYSLGALVILTALEHLSTLPASQTVHLVQDVFLMGTPAPTTSGNDANRGAKNATWTRVRRVVAGRLVNAYTDAESDYVLAFLSRVSLSAATGTYGVAGLQPVDVPGVENVKIEGVEGHVAWRGLVGRCLELCGTRGVRIDEARKQEVEVSEKIKREIVEAQKDANPKDSEDEDTKQRG